MALPDRTKQIMLAIRTTLRASTDITAIIASADINISKSPWHRRAQWRPGITIANIGTADKHHESLVNRRTVSSLVVVCVPRATVSQQDETQISEVTGIAELINDIFGFKGHTLAPAPLQALSSLYASSNPLCFKFHSCTVTPGVSFIMDAVENDNDITALVVDVDVTANKIDHSSLGA